MASGEINYWHGGTGATRSSWNQDDNWSILIPVDGEHVVVPASAHISLLTEGDRTGDTAGAGLDLASFTVERGSQIQLGQRGEPLQFAVSSGVVLFQGDGFVYYNPNSGSANDDTDSIVVDGGDVTIHVPDPISVLSVAALSGNLTLSTDAVGANTGRVWYLSAGSRGAASPGPTVETVGDSNITFVQVSGGDVVLGHTETTTLQVSGGEVTVVSDDLGASSLSIYAYVMGGRVNWVGGLSSGMSLVNMYAMGGILDLNASSQDKAVQVLVIHPAATVLHNRRWVTVTAYRDFGLDLFRSPSVSGTINTFQDVNTDWEHAANWDNGVPADDDHVVIPGTATNSLLLNMDQTGLGTGLRLASLTIHDDYAGDIGDAANPLKCTLSGRLIHRGSGTLYFNPKEGSAGTTTTEVIIDSPNSNDAAVINVDTAGNSLQWLEVLRGRVTATTADSPTAVISSIQVAGTAHVTVTAESRLIEVMQSSGAVSFSGQNMERSMCSGGLLKMLRDDLSDIGGSGTTRTYVARAGVFEWHGAMAAAKTPTIHAMGGTIDFNQTAAVKTIDNLFQHPRAKVKANRPWIVFDKVYDFGLADRSGS